MITVSVELATLKIKFTKEYIQVNQFQVNFADFTENMPPPLHILRRKFSTFEF